MTVLPAVFVMSLGMAGAVAPLTNAAEVDDMSMLRLLAIARPALTVVPPVVVRGELKSRFLVERCRIPGLQERFYAITRDRKFPNPIVGELLGVSRKSRRTS